MGFRFHCLGLPHTVTNAEYVGCAYTQKVLKFCKMMKARGHYIIHYGHEESNVICDEHVTVSTNKDLEIAYGNFDWRNNFFKFDVEDHAYKTFFKNAIEEVGKRKQPKDFILPFWGSGVRPICDAHQDMICVEPGIGYAGGHWARWKIFESYAVYHAYCNMTSCGTCKQDWYEAVVPNYFDLDDFDYCEEKEDYFLFLGRVYEGKGIHIAVQMTQELGVRLIVAGQQSLKSAGIDCPPHVTEIGYANKETRKKLMSKAKCGIVASMYLEPFGGVQMEMLLSGTPTITTDWGSFTENNIHGVTGYRCRTFEQFCWAGRNIDKIKPSDCRKWALNFSLEKVSLMYEEYFQMVMDVHDGPGWYAKHPDRPSLGWLEKGMCPLPVKPKIAVFSETGWAFGRIHLAIIKHMKQWYDFEYFDWGNPEHCQRLFRHEEWKNFDIILGNTIITYAPVESGWLSSAPQGYLNKCVAVGHTSAMNHPTLREFVINKQGPRYCGITQEVVDAVLDTYQVKCDLTHIGIDLDHFYPTREITSIKRAGIIGNPSNAIDLKRLDMFQDICEKAGLEPVFLFGKDKDLNHRLYEDIDVFMYTSSKEGAGLGILEAACCGIPVITTKVGYSMYLKNIKTFDTVDEAVALIKWLSDNNIKEYTETLSKEIRDEWNWKTVCQKYWKPVFGKRLKYPTTRIKLNDTPVHVLTIPGNEERVSQFKTWSKDFKVEFFMNTVLSNRNTSITVGARNMIEKALLGSVPFIISDDDNIPVGTIPEYIEIPDDADIVYLTNSSWRSTRDNTTGELGCFGYKINDSIYRVQNMLGQSMTLINTVRGAQYLLKCLTECPSGLPPDIHISLYQNDYNVYAFNKPLFYQPCDKNKNSTLITLDDYMIPQTFHIECKKYFSQYKQDEILDSSIFKGFKNGFFMDVGAHDGVTFNNTLYFEKTQGWTGINIEPIENSFNTLQCNRPKCRNYNCAISNVNGVSDFIYASGPDMLSGLQEYYDPRHSARLDWHISDEGGSKQVIKVQTRRIEDVLDENNIKHVHMLSIDVEGAEFEVVKSINFEKVFIDTINFENNYSDTSVPIIEYLKTKGYIEFNQGHELDIFMIHCKSQFYKKCDSTVYYYNNNYLKPIHVSIVDDKHVKVNSSYWNEEVGFVHGDSITFKTLGTGKINRDGIVFSHNNIWHRDTRKNILFIGANDMCEIDGYVSTYKNGLFIEAIPSVHLKLKENLSKTSLRGTDYIAINALVTSQKNKEYTFNVFDNEGASSSIYEPNMDTWKWSHVAMKEKIILVSTTISDVLKEYNWEDVKYDLVIDVQGAEMEVLKGFTHFNNVHTLKIEVSTKEFYKGGVLFEELDTYLTSNNFILVNDPSEDHCDVMYVRV